MQDIKLFLHDLFRRVVQSKSAVRLLRWAGMLAGAALVLLATATVLLHVWILPRIGEFRPFIQQQASQMLGLPVHIESITLTRGGWSPELALHQVQFTDAAGHSALRIARIEAGVSVRSLLRAGFTRLAVIAPSVQAQRHADGRIYIAGILLDSTSKAQPAPAASSAADAAISWLLEQPELEIRNGSLQWSDAQRNAAPLLLKQIQASLSNRGRNHALQVHLTPPEGWGHALTVAAQWQHGLLQSRANWREWAGQASADMPWLDVSQLRSYVDLGKDISLRQGQGSVRVQAQFKQAQSSTLAVDARLEAVDATLGKNLPALSLKNLQSQFEVRYHSSQRRDSYTLATSSLRFTTHEGQQWAGGNVRVQVTNGTSQSDSSGQVQGNDWDIATISHLASRLPLGQAMHKALATYQPRGQLQQIKLCWGGDINAPASFAASGQVKQLGWQAQLGAIDPQTGQRGIGKPGIEGANVRFDLNQSGGSMDLQLERGSAEFPGVFAEPRLPFDTLQAQVRWKIDGSKVRVELPDIRFANADAQGKARILWHTRDDAPTPSERLPGMLDLSATIEHARAERVVRYLPLELGSEALQYIKHSVRAGDAKNARIRVTGDLRHIASGKDANGKLPDGIFRFEVPLTNAEFNFMPAYLQDAGEKPWPALTQLDGLLVIDQLKLSVLNATARFSTAPDLRASNLNAHIPDLEEDLLVNVAGSIKGPLQQALNLSRQSPLSAITGQALDQATATGQADIDLRLSLPTENMDAAKVQGTVQLNGNDIRITPAAPLLTRSQGAVAFNECGFTLKGARAHLLGGAATLEGGTQPVRSGKQGTCAGSDTIRISAQGQFSGAGLQADTALGSLATLGRFLHGTSRYQAQLQFEGNEPEIRIDSDLAGMAIQLPPPFAKPAAGTLPLHYANNITAYGKDAQGHKIALADTLQVRLGQFAAAQYQRQLHPHAEPQVLRGSIAIGEQAEKNIPPLPESGVQAHIQLDKVEAESWSKLLEIDWGNSKQAASTVTPAATATAATAAPSAVAAKPPSSSPAAATDVAAPAATTATAAATATTAATTAPAPSPPTSSYLPHTAQISTPLLVVAGRQFQSFSGQLTRQNQLWELALVSRQVSGIMHYQPADNGTSARIKARLRKLTLEPASIEQVHTYVKQAQDPDTLPALDIDAENVNLAGYKLSRLILRASNQTPAQPASSASANTNAEPASESSKVWRIQQLSAWAPYSHLQATGAWGQTAQPANKKTSAQASAPRHVDLNVRFATTNLGGLLAHMGKPDLLSGGAGSMEGTIGWQGSPANPSLETLAGRARLDVRNGYLTSIDPGAAKLLGLFSLQILPRLGDLGTKGLGFSHISSAMRIEQGTAHFSNLDIAGAIADIKAQGDIALPTQKLNLQAVVLPKIDFGGAALIATAINPAIGLGSYVAQFLLSKPLSDMSKQVLAVQGTFDQPQVTTLQGQAARAASARVQGTPPSDSVADNLWNWQPVTHPQAAPLPQPATQPPATQQQARQAQTTQPPAKQAQPAEQAQPAKPAEQTPAPQPPLEPASAAAVS